MQYNMTPQEISALIKKEVSAQIESHAKLNAVGTYFEQNSGYATNAKNVFGALGDRIVHNIIRLNPVNQIIVSGKIVCDSSDILIDTESAAASDDLDTISVGAMVKNAEIIMLRAKNDARTVVVKHNTGNIFLAAATDFSLDSMYDSLILRYDMINAKWVEVLRTNIA